MDIRARIISNLNTNEFTIDQLKMIELAIAEGIKGLEIKEMETLPALREDIPNIVIEYLVRKQIKGLSKGSIRRYKDILKYFFAWWGSPDITGVKDTDIILFLAWYERTRNVSKRTLDGLRRGLHTFFKYAYDTGKISSNPTENIEVIKYTPRPVRPLTDEELEMVRHAAKNIRESALIETLYSTGCRISELVSMNISDIDFEKRELEVLGKGNKTRKVFINAKAKICILKYLKTRNDDCPALFVSERKPYKRLSKEAIEKIVDGLEHRSGIHKLLTPHVFRHTMATDMYDVAHDIVPVQKALGHAEPSTTQIYAEISDNRIKESHRRGVK